MQYELTNQVNDLLKIRYFYSSQEKQDYQFELLDCLRKLTELNYLHKQSKQSLSKQSTIEQRQVKQLIRMLKNRLQVLHAEPIAADVTSLKLKNQNLKLVSKETCY